MADASKISSAKTVMAMILLAKVAGVVLTTVTGLNVFAQSDVITFAENAALFADQIGSGHIPAGNLRSVTYTWPLTLSVFWFLPGPSWVYARVFVALLGGLAIYNVFVIIRYHHSAQAGVVAVLPMIVLPSYVFVHGSILRETVILLGFTSVVRILFVGEREHRTLEKFAAVVVILAVITLFRIPNLFVYVALLATAGIVAGRNVTIGKPGTVAAAVAGMGVSGAFLLSRFASGRAVVAYIANQRDSRAHGEAAYLADVVPDSALELVAFSWIGAVYFLFAPFPWMITEPVWIVAGMESLVNLVYVLFAIFGFRYLYQRTKPFTLALAVGFIVAVLMYGLIEGNVGPAIRHRQQFAWIAYAFGAVGMVESVAIR